MRATALSDPQLIQTVNDYCIAVELNVTTDGFPKDDMPALQFLESIYLSDWRTEFGFASCFLLDPEGKMILASSALYEEPEERIQPELNWSGTRYLKFVVKGLEKYEKIKSIRTLPPLMRIRPWAEVLNDMRIEVQTSVQNILDLKAYYG